MKNLFMALLLCLTPAIAHGAESEAETAKATESEAAAPQRKKRPLPFRSVIHSIDEEHRAWFRMGKHRLRKLHITPTTRFLLASGEEATAEDLREGADVRGSYRQRDDGDYDAITIKIGTKERY